MKNIKKWFYSIDFFQRPITLLFKSQAKIPTSAGIILSFLLYAILLLFILRSDMVQKKNPIISDTFVANEIASVSLNKMNFGLAISLEDNFAYYTYIDPSMFTINVTFYYIGLTENDTYSFHLSLRNCSKSDIDPSINLYNYCQECLCIDEYYNLDLDLLDETLWQSNYTYISIQINLCTNDIKCKPMNEILDYLQGKYFSVTFLEYFFDMQEYDNPAKINFQNSKEILIDKNLTQYISISMMEVEILQDSSSLFDNGLISYGKYFQQDSSQLTSSFNFRVSEDEAHLLNLGPAPPLAQFNFWPSLNKRKIIRKYQKLSDVLSLVGGLTNCLQFVGALITNLTCYLKILRNISRKINNSFEEVEENTNRTSSKPVEIENVEREHKKIHINSSIPNSIEMLSRNHNDIKLEGPVYTFQQDSVILNSKYVPKDENGIKFPERPEKRIISKEITLRKSKRYKERIKLKFSLWDYLKYSFCKLMKFSLNNKNKLIQETENSYRQNFDIIEILKRLLDLEKLKVVFFNKRQRILFDSTEINMYPKTKKDVSEVFNYYQNENNLEFFSDLDQRLIKLYKKNLI